MANLFNYNSVKNKPKRNGFDLSRKNIYTISAGELLPVMTEEIIPGDTIDIDLSSFTRTQPMNTAAFARMRQYYDFFFVPYHLLWSRFPNFISAVPNNQISSVSQIGSNIKKTEYAPMFDFNTLEDLIKQYQVQVGKPNPDNIERNKPLLDIAGRTYDETIVKLANYLGYPYKYDADGFIKGKLGTLSMFRFFAYQKIYSDYYRFDQWEDTDSALFNADYKSGNNNVPLNFGSFVGAYTTDYEWFKLGKLANTPFTLRYANYKRDLLRGVLPNQQFGVTSSVKIDANYTTSFVQELTADVTGLHGLSGAVEYEGANGQVIKDLDLQGVTSFPNVSLNNINGLRVNTPTATYLNVLALRFAEAAQRYNEIKGATSYDYIKQIQAHFGVTPSKGLSHRVDYLGGCVSDLSIDPVTNQNLTGENSPQIYGKGTFATSGKIHFESKDYGILMCISHVLPISDYSTNRISRKLRLNVADDWPIPEFDSLGLEGVTVSEIPGSVDLEPVERLNMFGYGPRYGVWKTALDEVHGDFLTNEKQWTITQDFTSLLTDAGQSTGSAHITWPFFKAVPSALDSIFAFGSDANGFRIFAPDQFLVNSYFDVKAVRNLDYDGMPY